MTRKIAHTTAMLAVMIYATLAGLRTMGDPDLWWQLSAAKYLLSTGHIARTEVFSYTAPGAPWTYPIGAGILFYAIHALGGVVLLSLVSPAACGITAWLLLRRNPSFIRCTIVALAMPAIAATSMVRANLFTTILAAAFLTILVNDADDNKLWMLPALMVAWVNLHPGFVYGVAMVLVFTLRKPRRLIPVAAATLVATLINPWGWRIYQAILVQQASMPLHRAFISEWSRMPLSWAVLRDSLRWRDPSVEIWWLFLLAALGVLAGLLRKHLWMPVVLAASAAAALSYVRFQGLFVIAAAAILPELIGEIPMPGMTAPAAALLIVLFTGWRSEQLITNEYYFSHGSNETFGVGMSPWMPVRAASFIDDHKLPRELYHDYGIGGYVAWRLAPRYPVFIDGRALPFGDALFVEQQKLGGSSPDKPEWTAAIEHWKIRTVLTALDRGTGYGVPVRAFCESPQFHLEYLDENGAVFVLNPTSLDAKSPRALRCETAKIAALPAGASRGSRYVYWANLARLYNELTRPAEAERAIEECRRIFDGDPSIYIELARLRAVQERYADAEAAYRHAIALSPSPSTFGELGDYLNGQQRFYEGFECMREAAARANRSHTAYSALAMSALQAGRPSAAYDAAGRALAESPFHGAAEPLGQTFTTRMHGIRAEALLAMVRIPEAIAELELAVRIAPAGSRLEETLYLRLADAYYQSGRVADARRALARSGEGAVQHDKFTEDPQGVAEANVASRKRLEWLLTLK